MSQNQNTKIFDLEKRTFQFAYNVRYYIKKVPKSLLVIDDLKQLLRSSASVGANYIEANECLSRKDFRMRVMICRKEIKESIYWLKLIEVEDEMLLNGRKELITEATELMKIFGAIIEKTK